MPNFENFEVWKKMGINNFSGFNCLKLQTLTFKIIAKPEKDYFQNNSDYEGKILIYTKVHLLHLIIHL